MTKKQLAEVVATLADLKPLVVEDVLNKTFNTIRLRVRAGSKVTFRGFGTFEAITRKTKKARNIQKGTEIIVPEHRLPVFKAGKKFKSFVK
jgi:DNA-binding protein HU-beta